MHQAVMKQDAMIDQDKISGLDVGGSASLRRGLAAAALVQMAVRDGEGSLVADGALATTTGPHTGRSPKDRFIVDRPGSRDAIDWGSVNQPLDAAHHERLWAKARAHVHGRDLYVQDLLAGDGELDRLVGQRVSGRDAGG